MIGVGGGVVCHTVLVCSGAPSACAVPALLRFCVSSLPGCTATGFNSGVGVTVWVGKLPGVISAVCGWMGSPPALGGGRGGRGKRLLGLARAKEGTRNVTPATRMANHRFMASGDSPHGVVVGW